MGTLLGIGYILNSYMDSLGNTPSIPKPKPSNMPVLGFHMGQ